MCVNTFEKGPHRAEALAVSPFLIDPAIGLSHENLVERREEAIAAYSSTKPNSNSNPEIQELNIFSLQLKHLHSENSNSLIVIPAEPP
jgi:hypothetical protein